ncbi:MAG: SUMF1/EgtB/PvdO family nonheme iron enzyme [Chloroflexi bacterium]|nr:SUMF1/EgtB/PvdO family nonheme iron enzyme [Chloroflexota bacterium]
MNRLRDQLTCALGACLLAGYAVAEVPVVTNVVATQRVSTKLVDIYYDAYDADGDELKVRVEVSHSSGTTYSVPAFSMSGDIGQGVTTGQLKHIVWDAGIDWDGEYSDIMQIKVIVSDSKGLPGLEWGHEIPPGGFLMGQDGGVEGIGPSRHVNIPWSYWLSKYEITIQDYVDFLNLALITGEVYREGTSTIKANGGVYEGVGAGAVLVNLSTARDIAWNVNNLEVLDSRTNFPVNVTWYGATAFAQHYGYDLPTEAEWEKAYRGPDHDGLEEHLVYPWGNALDGSMANYTGSGDPYDSSSYDYRGATPVGYYDGNQTPFGTNMANAYGIYDMSGNMFEWCRSKIATTVENYPQLESLTNSLHDLAGGGSRVLRGGGWGAGSVCNNSTVLIKCYYRAGEAQSRDYDANNCSYYRRDLGFRVLRRSLVISPDEITLTPSTNTQTFAAVGGVPPYEWSVAAVSGSISTNGGPTTIYTRSSSGTNFVTCTDRAGLDAIATIIQP